MSTSTKSLSTLSKFVVLMLSLATGACGELTADELATQDSLAPVTAPSLTDQVPVIDQRQPALPGLSDPEVAGEHAVSAPSGDATAASVVGDPGPSAGNGLAIQPRKGEGSEPAVRDLIPGNQPATGASELPPLSEPAPEPSACPSECPAGAALDPATCACERSDTQAAQDCRQAAGQWDPATGSCTPGAR